LVIIPVSSFSTATSTAQIYTLSLHDALPISSMGSESKRGVLARGSWTRDLSSVRDYIRRRLYRTRLNECAARSELSPGDRRGKTDRKSTRLNSSHVKISYAVFCLKKKKIRYT